MSQGACDSAGRETPGRRADGRRVALFIGIMFAVHAPVMVCAQQERFQIGGNAIYGNMRYPVPNTRWGSWVADTAARGSTDEEAIPTERWEQLQELGLTLAHITIVPERLTDGPDNVALKLNHAAWVRGMSLSLSDPLLWDVSRSERRAYHLESGRDFSERSGGAEVFCGALHDERLQSDRHVIESDGPNAIRFSARTDAGARIGGLRRGSELFADLGRGGPSGHYVLTVRCAFRREDLPEEDARVFTVELRTASGSERFTCGVSLLRAAVEGSAGMHEGGAARDTVVAEIFLGRIHLQGEERGDGTAIRIVRSDAAGPDPGYNERTRSSEALQMDFAFDGGMDITVDAVLLCDERAFALFHPGHPMLKPEERDLGSRIQNRMRLLGADSTAPWPALRYLEFSESLAEDGSDLPARAMALMLREAAGTRRVPVRPFVWASGEATKDSARIVLNEASMRGVVSGRYVYPFKHAFNVHPDDEEYYDSTYFPASWEIGGTHSWMDFQSLSEWFRRFAEARRMLGLRRWMPAVQTHSWLFRGGWPVTAINDTGWLYEPNAAEFRFQCNMALCYGATGVMLYQVCSWPGRAGKPNVVRRDDPDYGDMGSIGLLNPHDTQPRRRDTNGEDKWDSTRTFLRGALKQHGDTLSRLAWLRGYDCHALRPAERSPLLRDVQSWTFTREQGIAIDPSERRLVEIGEFGSEQGEFDADQGVTHLFVVNKRVDAAGHRWINLQLKNGDRTLELLPAPGVPAELHSHARGNFVLLLPPGHAALLRLR